MLHVWSQNRYPHIIYIIVLCTFKNGKIPNTIDRNANITIKDSLTLFSMYKEILFICVSIGETRIICMKT